MRSVEMNLRSLKINLVNRLDSAAISSFVSTR